MSKSDNRGCTISGSSPSALQAFEEGLAAWQGWRGDPRASLRRALDQAPGFVMAHVLDAYIQLCGREPGGMVVARQVLARARKLRANARERLHLAAVAAMTEGEYERAGEIHARILAAHPRDAIALQVAHACDYLLGNIPGLRNRVQAVLPAWSTAVPGYHAVLAMYAFGLEECGDYARAAAFAGMALELDPYDARAHHTMTHVFEMQGQPEQGERWLESRSRGWARDTLVATHCWWHMALFQLARGQLDGALALYDAHLQAGSALADMIDASALLWRLHLLGIDVSGRWAGLADCWAPRAADAFCAFSDLHAMMAFVAARREDAAERLLTAQARRTGAGGTNAAMTRLVGLPACRALQAFGRGDYQCAGDLLRRLPPVAHRLGGSQAQRGILELTACEANRRLRRSSIVVPAAAGRPDRLSLNARHRSENGAARGEPSAAAA